MTPDYYYSILNLDSDIEFHLTSSTCSKDTNRSTIIYGEKGEIILENIWDFKSDIYIKDDKELDDYIINNNKELKKIKKGSKDYSKKIDEEKSKMNIQRFKGLGEMNPEELWSTTLDPETRNLLQVQYSKDLKKDQSLIHTLMGNDVALRKDFIVSNAINVRNLDI